MSHSRRGIPSHIFSPPRIVGENMLYEWAYFDTRGSRVVSCGLPGLRDYVSLLREERPSTQTYTTKFGHP